jgi:hypothetical protein
MKQKLILLVAVCLVAFAGYAQKWEELSDEQKLMKLKTFRTENQKYMKDSLKLTPTQINDIDNINLCYLATLDRIMRYGKDDQRKEELAEAVSKARWVQIDVIIGEEKHDKYAAYLERRIAQLKK